MGEGSEMASSVPVDLSFDAMTEKWTGRADVKVRDGGGVLIVTGAHDTKQECVGEVEEKIVWLQSQSVELDLGEG